MNTPTHTPNPTEYTRAHASASSAAHTIAAGPAVTATSEVDEPRHRVAEVLAAASLVTVAGIHLSELSGKFREVPYIGVGYVALIVASVIATVLVLRGKSSGWFLGGAAALATLIGFVLTRTTGLPQAMDDIGNWKEPIAVVSGVAEAFMVLLSVWVLQEPVVRSEGRMPKVRY